jgi:glutaredoxin
MNIIVFTMDGCPWCQKLKEMLDEKGISYEAKDVDEYTAMYENFVKITQSDLLPAVLVGKNALVPQKSFNTIEQAVEVIEGFLENDH